MTYTAVSYDPNNWAIPSGINEIVDTCGHKHRTVRAAQDCIGKTCMGGGVPALSHCIHKSAIAITTLSVMTNAVGGGSAHNRKGE
jgi:hypothetical protein